MQTPRFIEMSEVLDIHNRQINKFGGTSGIRDEGLLDSALAQPQATFGGQFLHPTLPEQAAAYLYHLAKNQQFSLWKFCSILLKTVSRVLLESPISSFKIWHLGQDAGQNENC